MFDLSNVFAKVFVREFYRLNAGFFMVILTLTFGFMSGVEHKALAEFFIASPQLTLIPITVWTVYSLKVISFNVQRIALPENNFLYSFSDIPKTRQILTAGQTLFLQFTPVILYGILLIVMALQHNAAQPILLIVGSISFLLLTSALVLVRSLKTPIKELKTSALNRFIDKHTVRPLWWIYTTTVLRREPALFIGTKIFSGLLLFGVMRLYENETFDGRLLAMAASIAGIGNFMIMIQLQLFDHKYFSLMKNLPIKLFLRWIRLSFVTLIIVLPEIVLILKYSPAISLIELIAILILIPAIALTAYSLLYVPFQKDETYTKLTFAITMAHLLLILFKIPVGLLVIANAAVSWVFFNARYYTFELSTTNKK